MHLSLVPIESRIAWYSSGGIFAEVIPLLNDFGGKEVTEIRRHVEWFREDDKQRRKKCQWYIEDDKSSEGTASILFHCAPNLMILALHVYNFSGRSTRFSPFGSFNTPQSVHFVATA